MLARLAESPAVALVGPRQVGKTTLAKALGGRSFDLEQESDRLRLDLTWREVTTGTELVVLDEAQAWPLVFERLRGAIDQDRARCGRFLLLGSVSPALMTRVSESLTGRLSLVELTPLTVLEVGADQLDRLWLCGGFPDGGVLGGDRFPLWQRDYLALMAMRDLPGWGLPARPGVTERLLRMLAAVHGQLWNASELGKSLGLSHPTVLSYVDFLEGAFLVRRLRPWQENLKKRLTRTPRLYLRDTGLLHALHLVTSLDDLIGRPWVGASWEGFIVEQIIAAALQSGRAFDPWYFRTSDGFELDLMLDFGRERWAFEIKLTAHPSPGDLRRLGRAADLVGAQRRFLVSRTPDPITEGDTWSCRVEDVVGLFRPARSGDGSASPTDGVTG